MGTRILQESYQYVFIKKVKRAKFRLIFSRDFLCENAGAEKVSDCKIPGGVRILERNP